MEFVFLAVHSKCCTGWDLSSHIDTELTLNALHKALETRGTDNIGGLVHRSDQGVQYASDE